MSIRAYLGENIEPSPDGRSQVGDRSVFETIQWVLPSLLRIYAGGGNVVEFQPLGPGDEKAAEQETDYINYIVTQKNRWFDILLKWFQDALLTKNAYCLAYIDDYYQTETERYLGQSDTQISLLMSEEGVEAVQFSSYPDESQPPVPVMNPITGQPMLDPDTGMLMVQPVMLHDIVIRRTAPQRKLCFRVLPPERCLISDQTPDHTLSECGYFEYWDTPTISQIRQMGFQVADDIAAEIDADGVEEGARNRYGEQGAEENFEDPSLRRVKLRTIWIRHDTDGDGIAELQRVVLCGKEILLHEEETRIPVSSIVPYILTHRHIGLSMADILFDLQRIATAILRQGLDNLYQSNNVRWAYTDAVNLDDLLSSTPGGAVHSDGNPAENLMPLVPPFLFPQAIEGLEYIDAVKEKRSGVNKTFSGVDENSVRQTATGINQLSTMAAQRVEQIARVFAPGIEYLFQVAHELLIKHGHKRDVVKLRGQWVEIDPSTWQHGRDMRVCVGYGAGNKDMLVARLMNMWAIQTSPPAQMSGLATPSNLYETAVALTKASDFTAPEKFWNNPAVNPPPPPPPNSDQIWAMVEGEKIKSGERIKAAELTIEGKLKAAALDHQAEVAEIMRKAKADADKLSVENAELRNEVARLSIERQDSAAEREKKAAEVEKIKAETEKIREETNTLAIEGAALDSDLDAAD